MCGIVGIIVKAQNGPSKDVEDTFYDMLYADTLRGEDSTGVIYVENNKDFSIVKDSWAGHWCVNEFRNTTAGKNAFMRGKALIGHNRKATLGAVTSENAHPFVVDKAFALVHNGSLRDHKKLADTTVDSAALAQHLRKVLVEDFDMEAFEDALGKVDGAYAIVCYNQDTNKVYMFRNHERPLALVTLDSGWYFSSEQGLVTWCVSRNGLNITNSKVEPVKPNCLYTFDLTKNTLTQEDYVPKKATPPVVVHTGGNGTEKTKTTACVPFKVPGKGGDNGMSRNQFRQWKKRYIDRVVEFWAADYVEKNFPRTIDEHGETLVLLMGESDEFVMQHTIHGEFDLVNSKNADATLNDALFLGRIYDVLMDKKTKHLNIYVDRITPIRKSTALVKAINEASSTVH